jgi:hypothetical protein
LLPVWGEAFIDAFLAASLPTLLAEGNVPALARTLPTRFVFLTRQRDELTIRGHPAYARLRQVCDVGFLPIDDLIMSGNHSTTITLGWERAVRREGEAMLDTCLVFLVSDYVMADGSLATIARHMMAGISGIQAGNFQLNEEVADSWLNERLAASGEVLSLKPREMVRWGLDCLHPATIANIVNYPLCHNTHVNRLFWRVDRNTLIGRFYLLHQICIRPERTDFVIGSASDYSFIAEMCPSGNVVTIADSDEYFVAEVQPYGHEFNLVRFGPTVIAELAASLSEWTNGRHRLNARQPIVFHAAELPPQLAPVLAEADRFIAEVTPLLGPVQPYRNHPYWIGAIAAFNAAKRKALAAASPPALTRLLRWTQSKLVGYPPLVTRAHPRWHDYAVLLATCETLAMPSSRLLIGAGQPTPFIDLLQRRMPDAVTFPTRALLLGYPIAEAPKRQFEAAFLQFIDSDLEQLEQILCAVVPFLREGGEIVVSILNTDRSTDAETFGRRYALGLASFLFSGLVVKEFRISAMSRWRWRVNQSGIGATNRLVARSRSFLSLNSLAVALWAVPALVANWAMSFRAEPQMSRRGIVSSAMIRFSIDSNQKSANEENRQIRVAQDTRRPRSVIGRRVGYR